MNKFTVISNHGHVTCDHVYAENVDAAIITVAAARPDAEIIVVMKGHDNELWFAGESVVDGDQLIMNAENSESQIDVLRSLVNLEKFEIKQGDAGGYFWMNDVEKGPWCESEFKAIYSCLFMNCLVLSFNNDGSLGIKP